MLAAGEIALTRTVNAFGALACHVLVYPPGARCRRGHTGALCGACKPGFEHSGFTGKCSKCGPFVRIVGSAEGIISALCVVIVVSFLTYRFVDMDTIRVAKQAFLDMLTGKMNYREAEKTALSVVAKREPSNTQQLAAKMQAGQQASGQDRDIGDRDIVELKRDVSDQQSLGATPSAKGEETEEEFDEDHVRSRKYWTAIMSKMKV